MIFVCDFYRELSIILNLVENMKKSYIFLAILSTWINSNFFTYIIKVKKANSKKLDLPSLKNDITKILRSQKHVIYCSNMQSGLVTCSLEKSALLRFEIIFDYQKIYAIIYDCSFIAAIYNSAKMLIAYDYYVYLWYKQKSLKF